MSCLSRIVILFLLGALCIDASAKVSLPNFFTNNMVLQRGMKISIWGYANPNEKVHIALGSNSSETSADVTGMWEIKLKPMPAGGPYTLQVNGENQLSIKNVLIGDIWVCAGQSNMELPVKRSNNAKKEIENANHPNLRLFTVDHQANADSTRTNVKGEWSVCDPTTVVMFSGVGYFFGRELEKQLNVPIGLIDIGWSATRIEGWISQKALGNLPFGRKEIETYLTNAPMDDANGMAGYTKSLKEAKEAIAKGTPNIEIPEPPRPSRKVPSSPGALFNYMTYPLTHLGIKGVIWYQGEANSRSQQSATDYRTSLPTLIQDWRAAWNQGNFPFLFVQLPNFQSSGFWPLMREAMLKTYLADKKTGMAITIDVGHKTDIHPSNKQDVGYRLALQALDVAYHKNIVSQGPLFKSMKVKNSKLVLTFSHVGTGLVAANGDLKGFEIAGADQVFHPASGILVKNKVELSSDKVSLPVAVRYAWADYPDCNLYNQEHLPASPFRTDSW
jgi:sialate O-acetylesterase